jgi:molecular chaperone Hsp33
MDNVLRALVYDNQVSLTLADVTEMVKEGKRRHRLSQSATYVFGKTLAAMTFMSACLKEEKGEISLAIKSDGLGGDIAVSGNRSLFLRGYIDNTQAVGEESEVLGEQGALTIIRDDGYNIPFVGSCALAKGEIDPSFEEYFRISEQLPTYLKTTVEFDQQGEVAFAGIAVLQPLPFATPDVLEKVQTYALQNLLDGMKDKGVEACAAQYFEDRQTVQLREARYQCNCSREYLKRVLVSLGKAQTQEVLDEQGSVKIHCHYCNTDYEFTQEDADCLFENA